MAKIKLPECTNCSNDCSITTRSKEPIANCPFCGETVLLPFADDDDDYEDDEETGDE